MNDENRKPRIDPGKTFPLRELKRLPWETKLWAYSLRESLTGLQAIDAIMERTGIELSSEGKYSDFCSWFGVQLGIRQKQEEVNDEAETIEAWFAEHLPNATPEQRRAKIIERVAMKLSAGDNLEPLAIFLKRWQDETALEGQREDRKLEQQRFNRQTTELFIKWSEDKRAQEILATPVSNDQKTELLGKLLFGEDWK